MKYANLFGLVILTIILIFVVQTISIRARITLDHADDNIKEGATVLDIQTKPNNSIPDCLVPVHTQNIVKSTLGPKSYTTCWEIEQLLQTFKKLIITNMTDVLTHANNYLKIKTCSELNQVLNRIVRVCPNTTFNTVFEILHDFGIRNSTDLIKFIDIVELRKLNIITTDYYVFPCGKEQDSNCLINVVIRIGARFEDFEDLIKISAQYGVFKYPVEFYKFLNIAHSVQFGYSHDNYIKLLRNLQNHVATSSECNQGSIIFQKMCSLQKLLTSINSNWGTYISCVEQITSLAGSQPELLNSVRSFMDYWNNGCTSDGTKGTAAEKLYKKLSYDANNIAQMVYVMHFINHHTNDQYFNYYPGGTSTNLNIYWKSMKNEKFTIFQIIQQANKGSTAPHYVNKRSDALHMENFETASPSMLESLTEFWRSAKYYLFGKEGLILTQSEMITKSKRMKISDDQALINFGITSSDKLLDLESSMNKYTKNSRLSDANSDWDNMIVLVNTLQSAGITYTNWTQYLKLMIDFGATTVHMWIEVLGYMAELNIKTYDLASRFIKTLVKFKVRYNDNFSMFMEKINNFGFAKLRNNFNNFELFVGNMETIGYNYKDNSNQVNTILAYLTKLGFDFTQYVSGSLAQNIIMLLFKYSSTTNYSGNALKDILNYKRLHLNNIKLKMNGHTYEGPVLYQPIAMQATIIAKGNQSENNLIYANKQDIIPFLYEKEFKQIVEKNQFSELEIVKIMKSVGRGIHNYADSLDKKMEGVAERIQRLDVVRVIIDMYPYTVFQFLTTEILSNPDQLFSSVAENGANKKSQFRPKN